MAEEGINMLKRFALLLSVTAMVTTLACAKSDTGVTTSIKTQLAADDTVKAYQIDVDTNDRVVTLSGTVETGVAKERAVTIARQTSGVRDVVDHITVSRDTAATSGDLEQQAERTAREARDQAGKAGEAIRDSGRDLKEKADSAAGRTGEAISDAGITSAVKTKLIADTVVSGLNIDVDTKDGVVTLTGTAASRAEADRAMSIARDTSGVKHVMNKLRIAR